MGDGATGGAVVGMGLGIITLLLGLPGVAFAGGEEGVLVGVMPGVGCDTGDEVGKTVACTRWLVRDGIGVATCDLIVGG